MDRTTWLVIRHTIRAADRSIPRIGRRPTYRDELIAKMYFWSVAHDRPLYWACQRTSYNRLMRPRRLPSNSQFCKRVRDVRLIVLIRRVCELLAGLDEPITLGYIDGKALPVSESTKDPDVRIGRGNGKFSRGYKLHAFGDSLGRIRDFRVRPMNEGEPTIARKFLMRRITPGAVIMADGNYDGRKLYSAVARRKAYLLTPQKKNQRTEAAFRNTCPERRRVMELWRDQPKFMNKVYAERGSIERIFSALTCFAGGLGPLPAWVRRIGRVTRWVTAKIAIYNARVLIRIGPS